MCTAVIIDANVFGSFRQDRFSVLRRWIDRGDGRVVYSTEGQYADELQRDGGMTEWLNERRSSGIAEVVPAASIIEAAEELGNRMIRSNDRHVLELAQASGASVLASDDRDLQTDFRNVQVLAQVGRRSRAVYPSKQARKRQRDFVSVRRCSNR